MSEHQPRGSGARTIALLKLVAEIGGTFTLSELAARAGVPPSSVHRLLQPLVQSGLVERAHGQAYQIGDEFLRMAALVMQKSDIRSIARPILQQMWAQWQETCSICRYRPQGKRALVLDTIQTPNPLRFVLEPFTEISLVWGSLGRAILAFLDECEIEEALNQPGVGPLSQLPAPSKDEMRKELARIRRQGYALYLNSEIDLAGIAAPVYDMSGEVMGSVGISLPKSRLPARSVKPMAETVLGAAHELSRSLGHLSD